MPDTTALPELIESEAQLDEVMTRPSATLVELVKTLRGPLLILGAGGKMGPTLAALARRAVEAEGCGPEIIAVSRFSDTHARDWLEAKGVRTINADLLSRDAVRKLPDAENLIYLV